MKKLFFLIGGKPAGLPKRLSVIALLLGVFVISFGLYSFVGHNMLEEELTVTNGVIDDGTWCGGSASATVEYKFDYGVHDKNIHEDDSIDKNFILGKFDYAGNNSFCKVDSSFCKVKRAIYLNKEVYNSFVMMCNKAKEENIDLAIISGTRNFNEQKIIWESKWSEYENHIEPIERAREILEYSSMPSTSRHHWGTDIDINSVENSYFETGKGKEEYDWLVENASDFGFYQVYTDKNDGREGYNMEKWHWSYLPLASKYLNYYNENIKYGDIKGFEGSEFAKELDIINNYVNGISQEAKHNLIQKKYE